MWFHINQESWITLAGQAGAEVDGRRCLADAALLVGYRYYPAHITTGFISASVRRFPPDTGFAAPLPSRYRNGSPSRRPRLGNRSGVEEIFSTTIPSRSVPGGSFFSFCLLTWPPRALTRGPDEARPARAFGPFNKMARPPRRSSRIERLSALLTE